MLASDLGHTLSNIADSSLPLFPVFAICSLNGKTLVFVARGILAMVCQNTISIQRDEKGKSSCSQFISHLLNGSRE